MQINNTSSVNFNGYRNLLTSNARVGKKDGLVLLSMQLDNIGKTDLDIWKNIQRKGFSINEPSDVFTVELYEGFGDSNLLIGNKNMDPHLYEEGSKEETLLLKTFTWMADLTKRIMNENNPIVDSGRFKVFQDTINNITPLFGYNKGVAQQFVLDSQNPNNNPQEAALEINEGITEIMQDYFL